MPEKEREREREREKKGRIVQGTKEMRSAEKAEI